MHLDISPVEWVVASILLLGILTACYLSVWVLPDNERRPYLKGTEPDRGSGTAGVTARLKPDPPSLEGAAASELEATD